MQAHRHQFRRHPGRRRRLDENRGHLALRGGQRGGRATLRRSGRRGRVRPLERLRMPFLQVEALHVDVHPAVHGRAGAGKDAGDGERIVHRAVVGGMRRRERVAHREAQRLGDARSQHALEEGVVPQVAAGGEAEGPAARGEPVEVVGVGAHDAVALEIVPHADRHGGGHAAREPTIDAIGPAGRREEVLVGAPGDVLDRLADQIHAVEHQLQRAPLGTHDHVVAQASAALEGPLHDPAGDERGDDERHAERERQSRQPARREPLPDVPPGDAQERHVTTPNTAGGRGIGVRMRSVACGRQRRDSCRPRAGLSQEGLADRTRPLDDDAAQRVMSAPPPG